MFFLILILHYILSNSIYLLMDKINAINNNRRPKNMYVMQILVLQYEAALFNEVILRP